MSTSKDSLFLLEVLVEKIKFIEAPCFSDGAFQTCVNISAPNVEPLEICDDDSGLASGGGPFLKTFNSGKSCLFFMKEAEIQAAMSKFIINVTVFKKLPCGCLPAKIQLGQTSIDMTKEFVQARNQNLQSPGSAGFQALQDTFRIIGADHSDTAEIVMFFRLSCFGGLIVTKFQGAAGPITLGAGAIDGTNRSCNAPRAYQTEEDPCVCGAHASGKKPLMGNTQICRGGGSGVCPPARDPYSVMPCAEPDDACFCTGPHPVVQTPLACRNTNAYCLHVPKGSKLSLPLSEELIKGQKKIIGYMEAEAKDHLKANIPRMLPVKKSYIKDYLMILKHPDEMKQLDKMVESCSLTSDSSSQLDRPSIYFSDIVGYDLDSSCNSISSCCLFARKKDNYYGRITTVFMNIWNIFGPRVDSGTQATASVNKSFQVSQNYSSSLSSRRTSKTSICENDNCLDKKGMGASTSNSTKLQRTTNMASVFTNKPLTVVTCCKDKCESSDCESQTKKCVTIHGATAPCTTVCNPTTDLTGMVSHIKIGQKPPACPIHPLPPVDKNEVPVKISTCTNCRRGVFELVIRRMNGAPLAKNELMLEWTPPPCSMPTPCSGFGPPCRATYCYTMPSCVPSRCKLVMCKPPRCKSKYPPRGCKSPCGPIPCGPPVPWPLPCQPSCSKCCQPPCRSKPCRSRRCRSPCPPPRIRTCKCSNCSPSDPCSPCSSCKPSCSKPCGPPCGSPCGQVCGKPCGTPCRSACSSPCSPCPPCVRPCPVGLGKRRRKQRVRKIKPHRKRISPCLNRWSSCCPALRCTSLPQTCVVPGPCAPCRPKRCKPRCCKSVC